MVLLAAKSEVIRFERELKGRAEDWFLALHGPQWTGKPEGKVSGIGEIVD
jgi:hypothetical protein